MKDDLFFMPILAEAMRQPDKNAALKAAFLRIQDMGRQPRYRQGMEQFWHFMEIAGEACTIEFVVERDGKHVGDISISPAETRGTIGGIVSGMYTVKMSTGRMLWEGSIVEDEVIWSKAFKGEPLRLAAATEGTQRACSKKIGLLNGEVVLCVYPGVEAGEMGIDLKRDE